MVNKQLETVRQFQQGHEQAYAALYDEFGQRLYYFAMRFVVHSAEAEDIVTEAFLKLWDRRGHFENEDAIIVFLHRTVKNRCLDYLKHEAIKNKSQADLIDILSQTADSDFSDEMIRLELMRQIYEQVDKLPEKMKEVFNLSYKEGLKPARIAELLQINVQTVKNQRVNAIKLLKNALKDKPLLVAYLVWLDRIV